MVFCRATNHTKSGKSSHYRPQQVKQCVAVTYSSDEQNDAVSKQRVTLKQ